MGAFFSASWLLDYRCIRFCLISYHNLTFKRTCWGLQAAAKNPHPHIIMTGGKDAGDLYGKNMSPEWNIPADFFLFTLFHHRFPVRVTHLQGWRFQTCALPLGFWALLILLMINIMMILIQIFFVFPLSWSLRLNVCGKLWQLTDSQLFLAFSKMRLLLLPAKQHEAKGNGESCTLFVSLECCYKTLFSPKIQRRMLERGKDTQSRQG